MDATHLGVCAPPAQDTVRTAPTDVVLAGTFRSLVLEVCAENHIPISLHCPQVSTIDRWQSIFITSTLSCAFFYACRACCVFRACVVRCVSTPAFR
jgi:hypothetical protein